MNETHLDKTYTEHVQQIVIAINTTDIERCEIIILIIIFQYNVIAIDIILITHFSRGAAFNEHTGILF